MQTKLTLRLEKELIDIAKQEAKKNGKSLSQMVADYFSFIKKSSPHKKKVHTPITGSLKGILKSKTALSKKDYCDYLEKKYR